MPSFEKQISHNQDGDNLQCLIDMLVNKCEENENIELDISQNRIFPALIDTGATHTCISKEIIDALELVSDEKMLVSSASHKDIEVRLFQVHLYIPIAENMKQ